MSYFTLSQTKFYQLFRQCIFSQTKLTEMLLTSINGLMQYDFNRINQGELYPTFVPYVNNTEVDSIFIAFQAMHYAIAQFTQSMLTLDYTVHTIFELQTTHFYR